MNASSVSASPAAALIARSLVWDNHACMPTDPTAERFLPQLARHRRSGFDVVSLNIGFGEQGVEEHLRTVALMRHWIAARPADHLLIDDVDDIETARTTGRLGVVFDIEGANGIGDQLSLLEMYRDLGVRWMLMAYNRNNRVGGGCKDDDGGLTDFGRAVLDEMERVGIVACCSHTGRRTALDVMDRATRPVIFSHSNARALHDHPRNIDDDLMRRCAATGGVVGINGIGTFLGDNDNSIATYVRHVDHAVQRIGAEHVAIGLDYVFDTAGFNAYLKSVGETDDIRLVAPESIEAIVAALMDLGYREADCAAILGGNLMRVARAAWKPRGAA